MIYIEKPCARRSLLPYDRIRILLGDIENGNIPTTIIPLSKKVICDAFKKDRIPALAHIQNESKDFFYLEKYDFYLKHKSHIFDRKWNLVNIYYSNQG